MSLSESQGSERGLRLSPAALAAQARRWLADSSHRSLAQKVAGKAFLIRVVSAGLIYLSQIFFARWLGTSEFGIYVYVWTWVLMIGDMADLGLATAAQRFVPEYVSRGTLDLLRGYLSRSRWLAIASATAVAVVGVLIVQLLAPGENKIALPLTIACVTLPFYSLMQVQDGIARSFNWIQLALLPPYVLRHVVMLMLVSAAWFWDFPNTAETAVVAVGASFLLTVIGQGLLLNRRLARVVQSGPKRCEIGRWYSTALPILMVEGCYMLLASSDILVLQQFRPSEDVGVYYAAAKTLALIAFVHFAISAAVGHRFTEYHTAGDRARLKALLADAVRWTFWASLAATVVILAAGPLLLLLFGPRFADGYHLMFILAIGLMARAAVGPAERLLSMLGEQLRCAAVYAGAFMLNLALCVMLIPSFGPEGAAASTALALTVESVMLYAIVKRRLGLHAFIVGRS